MAEINLKDVPINFDGDAALFETKTYEMCKAFIQENYGHSSVSSYIVVNNNGKKLMNYPGTYCHASWFHGSGVASYFAQGTLIGNAFNKADTPAKEEFYDFFVKRSMWSRFILNRNDPTTNKKGTIIDCSLPRSIVQSINIAGRIIEWKDCCEAWKFLVDHGVNPDIALLWMSQFGCTGSFGPNGELPSGGTIYKALTGHMYVYLWDRHLSQVHKLSKGVVDFNINQKSPSSLLFGVVSPGENSLLDLYKKTVIDLPKLKKGLKIVEKAKSEIVNPFSSPNINNIPDGRMSVEDFVEYFLPIVKRIIEHGK